MRDTVDRMMTRAFAIVTIVLTCAGCDDKKGGAAAKELERYVNEDAALAMAYAVDANQSISNVRAADVADPAVARTLRTRTVPHYDEFLTRAPAITPPKGHEYVHTRLVELVTAYRKAANDMLVATGAGDADGFTKGHELMMETAERFHRWDIDLMNRIREHGVPMKAFPSLPDEPSAEPSAAPDAPAAPAASAKGATFCDGTARISFHDDGSLRSCVIAAGADVVISGIPVEPGKEVTLFPDGSLQSGTLFGFIAADGFACGAAPLRRFPNGDFEECLLLGDATIGGVAVPEKSRMVRHAGGALRYAKHPDGKEVCFDAQGAAVTPCAAPTF
jgi:hypothetical protein